MNTSRTTGSASRATLVVWLCLAAAAAAQDVGPVAPGKPTRVPAGVRYRPSPAPDRIVLTFCGDPATTMAVTWRTDRGVTTPRAEVGPAGDDSAFAGRAEITRARSEDLTTDLGEARYHSAVFSNLIPGTRYAYRVGDGANWSEWFQFTTASRDPRPFSFVYFGDAQNDIKDHWSRVIRQSALDATNLRFLIHAGDLINTGSDAEWGEWFGAGGWLNGSVASVPTPGNHEYAFRRSGPALAGSGGWFGLSGGQPGVIKKSVTATGLTPHWRAQFTLPEDGPAGLEETVYSFDYQGVRVISLNSNERIEDQVPWLEGRLRDNPNPWTVVTFHHPVYSTAAGRDNKRLRDTWQPVFDRYRVDLVLQGHDHSYGRSGLAVSDNLSTGPTARDPNAGTVYVVSVSGPKMYELGQQSWMRRSASHKQLYQVIRVDGGRLNYEAHTATGELYDSFELRKRPGRANELVERETPDSGQAQGVVGLAVIAGVVAALLALTAVRRVLRKSAGVP